MGSIGARIKLVSLYAAEQFGAEGLEGRRDISLKYINLGDSYAEYDLGLSYFLNGKTVEYYKTSLEWLEKSFAHRHENVERVYRHDLFSRFYLRKKLCESPPSS